VNPEVLIIGCGFLGETAAEFFSAHAKRVLGLVRSHESLAALSALSGRAFEVGTCDVTDSESMNGWVPRLRGVPLAIYAVSAGRGGAETYAEVYREGLRRVIDQWRPERIIFVSSTSVYGQDDGSWVNEGSPTLPDRETGRILLEAEKLALAAGGGVARFSGIYGPGRSMLLKKFLAGDAVLENGGHRWMNQIHREDGAAALFAMGDSSIPAGIYNVSDDRPVTQRELYGWMAQFLDRPLPPEGALDLNRKRGVTSKRVGNGKLHATGWRPRYPSYRDALPQLIDSLNTR
jgi:nucleoside-diphosphate-sugar epimerase